MHDDRVVVHVPLRSDVAEDGDLSPQQRSGHARLLGQLRRLRGQLLREPTSHRHPDYAHVQSNPLLSGTKVDGLILGGVNVKLSQCTDGTSNTALLSEIRLVEDSVGNDSRGRYYNPAHGGVMFTTLEPPNSQRGRRALVGQQQQRRLDGADR